MNDSTLCLWVPCLGELVSQSALKPQPESGGQEARQGTIVPFPTSYEAAPLGSVPVYLVFVPVSPVWLSCQLSGSLPSPASQYSAATYDHEQGTPLWPRGRQP